MRIKVQALGGERHRGILRAGTLTVPCALGRSGLARAKREGDGATPLGTFPLRRLFHRPDRLARPRNGLDTVPISPALGWCDDPASPRYNRLVRLPFEASHEKLWRADRLYDLFIEIGYNDSPPVRGLGSAIFLHLARPGYAPTEGCVAIARPHMLALLPRLTPDSVIEIG